MKKLISALAVLFICFLFNAHSYSQITTVTITPTDVLCKNGANGSAKANPIDGTQPYTYEWTTTPVQTNRTATGLSAGSYTVKVTDNTSASVTATVTITEPAAISFTALSQINVYCHGGDNGAASLTATGGTGILSYDWIPGSPLGDGTASVSGLKANTYTCMVTDANSCTAAQLFAITEPPALIISSASQTDVSCKGGNNGTASVTVSGGASSTYLYAWLPSGGTSSAAIGLSATTYTCTVTDNNSCTAVQTFTISAPANALSLPSPATTPGCNGGGGTATANPTGGTLPYVFAWLPSGGSGSSATGLSARNYTVTVTDAHSCSISNTVTVVQSPAMTLTITPTHILCNGGKGAATVAVSSGGTGPFTYVWNTSPAQSGVTATGLSAGSHVVTVTDASGCSKTANVTITQPSVLSGTISKTPGCNGSGGTATAITTGGVAPYIYAWSPSGGTSSAVAGLSAGNYTVVITDDNNCSTSNTVTIVQSPAITLTITPTNILCNGGKAAATVSASGGMGAYTYGWNTSPVQNGVTATGLSAGNYVATVTDVNGCSKTASVTITQPAVLTLTLVSTNVTCFGANNGTASVSVAGGTTILGSYTYAWSPSGGTSSAATGLSAGNYTITVTDANGCSKAASVTIAQPSVLSINNVTQTTVGCNGGFGSATAAVSGGTSPYTFAWSPSGGSSSAATGLSAGNYTVTVQDKEGCLASNTITIISSAINLITSQINVLCNGGKGAATAIASLGTLPYTYVWSPVGGSSSAATGLSAGNYSVTVTETMGCSATATVVITQPAVLTLTVTETNILCAGANNGTATASCSGGTAPYKYAWTGGQTTSTATGLSVGAYTVTVTDANGCTKIGSANIIQPAALLTTVSQTNGCNSGLGTATVNAAGGTGAYTYSWNSSPVQTTKTAVGLPVGSYSVLVTDANGCTTFNAVAIAQLPIINLTTSQTTIACNGGKSTATANASGGAGAFTYLWTPGGQNTSVVSGLSPGNYSVTVTDGNLCSATNTLSITEPAALTLTVTKSSIACYGGKGSATATLTGGTLPYIYVWSTSPIQTTAMATGLDVGNYSIAVTDANGCTKSGTTNITQPTALVTTTAQFHIYDGATGSSSATVSGGVPGYTYNWSTTPFQSTSTATGLYAGNYAVTVTDANGCTTKNIITIIATQTRNLAAGFDHSFSKCQTNVTVFGKNNYGQLGDGTIVSKDTAITLASLTNVMVLEGGGVHSLALKNDGNIWAWGRSNNGQLGLGNTTDQHTPVVLNSINKVIAISGGGSHSLALKNDGTAWAWGLNTNGQLGDNTTVQRTSPVKVNTLTNIIYISSGANHSLAIVNDSTVWAWGANASGQLGDKSTSDRHVPVKVKNMSGVIAVDGGNGHSLALKEDGTVWAWGLNTDGQLGDGTNVSKDTAVKVQGLFGIVAVSAGDKHSLALRNDGTVWAWGLNADGQLGDYTSVSRNTPVNVNGLTGITSIQGGGNHSLAVKSNGQVWAWGKNTDGQLGDKTNASKNHPVLTHMPCLIKNLAVNTVQINVKCNGGNTGNATAIPTGGAPVYKYSWSTSPVQTTAAATGLSAGNYSVTVTDANTFASTVTLTITQPAALTASVTTGNVSCFGANNGTAGIVVTGGTPNYNYVWNTVPNQTTSVVTGLKPGNYTAYSSDANSCNVTNTVTITQPSSALIVTVAGIINATSCANKDGSIITVVSGGVPNYTYAWSTTPVQTTATAAGLGQGTYTLTVTDANNCMKIVSDVVTCPTGINILPEEIEFTVYPNPSNGKYEMSSGSIQSGTFSVEVYSLLGEKVYSVADLNAQYINEIDISQQPEGVYFLHIKIKDGANGYQSIVKKIIKD